MCPGTLRTPGTTGATRESGGLAQLARAPALQAGGQRFESVILHRQGPEGPAEIFDMLYKQDCS